MAKRFWSRGTTIFLIVIVLGIATGSVGGFWLKNNLFNAYTPTDYSNMSEAKLRDDEYKIAVTNGFATKVPTNNKEALINAFIAAEYNGKHADNFYMLSESDVIVHLGKGIKQGSYLERIYDGKTMQTLAASEGTIDIAEKSVYDLDEPDKVFVYKAPGKSVKRKSLGEKINCSIENCTFHNKDKFIFTADYNVTPRVLTLDEYKEELGNPPITLSPYIVSSKTVINNPAESFKKITLPNGATGYQFTLELDKKTSVLGYVHQMKHLSGLSGYPTFTSVKLDVILTFGNDGKIYFHTIDINEDYIVPYNGMSPNGTGYAHNIFCFNQEDLHE